MAFSIDQDRFPQRRNANLSTLYKVGRTFAPGVADSISLIVSDRRRDNYISEAADVESQRETVKGGSNTLHYRLSERTRFSYNTQLEFKTVELALLREKEQARRRRRLDQRIANDAAVEWQNSPWQALISLSHLIQQQHYDLAADGDRPFSSRIAFVTPDNNSSRLVLSAFLRRYARRDSLTFFVSANKFRYDTPDTSNYDDRDELRINTRLLWVHRLSPELVAEWATGVNLYHMVYIYGERSADNNWNRILFMKPRLAFSPSQQFSFHQSLEVLANYVDYDFEESFVSTRSFVFRKFSLGDSLYWQLMPHSALIVDYRLQLEENGQLYWQKWSERIVGTRSLQWLQLSWQYSRGFLRSRAGYAEFKRDEHRYLNNAFGNSRKEPAGSYLSRGPVLSIGYYSSTRLRLQIEAARSRVQVSAQKPYYVNSIDLSVRWLF
ncbi:MAG: hypothetical protein ONA69_01045 [candidate division KSB1 bacterium]|nr:hypothetical protein [candidate division KSB1 bacterium]